MKRRLFSLHANDRFSEHNLRQARLLVHLSIVVIFNDARENTKKMIRENSLFTGVRCRPMACLWCSSEWEETERNNEDKTHTWIRLTSQITFKNATHTIWTGLSQRTNGELDWESVVLKVAWRDKDDVALIRMLSLSRLILIFEVIGLKNEEKEFLCVDAESFFFNAQGNERCSFQGRNFID